MSAKTITFAGLAALAVAMGVGRFAFTPILPIMQADAGLSIFDGSWLAAANYLGYLLGALTAIRLPLKPVTVIRGALVAISLTTLAMGLHENFTYWVVLRTVAGVASAWVLVFVSAWALAQRAQSGVLYAGVGTGIAGAGMACLVLMAMHATSSTAWIALSVVPAMFGTVRSWMTEAGAALVRITPPKTGFSTSSGSTILLSSTPR